jgi:hypothetical protein
VTASLDVDVLTYRLNGNRCAVRPCYATGYLFGGKTLS